MLQLNPPRKVYDVCIIGSGAGGGTAAKVLTEGGLNVVMLEAGPRLDPDKDFKEHVWPYQLPHRGVVSVEGSRESAMNSWRPMDSGRLMANRTRPRLARHFAGFDHASREAEQTIGAASRSGLALLIFEPTRPMEWVTTGRSATRSSRLTTTR